MQTTADGPKTGACATKSARRPADSLLPSLAAIGFAPFGAYANTTVI
jgi:hypothetical protein